MVLASYMNLEDKWNLRRAIYKKKNVLNKLLFQNIFASMLQQLYLKWKLILLSLILICTEWDFFLLSPPVSPSSNLNLRCHFDTTVSCTRSGGGPIRKCACSCLIWRGRTPPSAPFPPSWPRKWQMRLLYEHKGCREEYWRGNLLKHSKTQTKKKTNHINELLHFIWTILRGEICSPVFFHRSTWCKILRYWLQGPNPESQFMLKHTGVTGRPVLGRQWYGQWTRLPAVRQWHKCIQY